MIKLKSYAAKTETGPYLQVNEDDIDIDLMNHLYVVYDGFGGSNIGDKCVSISKENIKKFYTKISSDPDSTLPFYFSPKFLIEGNALINAVNLAHREILKLNASTEMSERGGVCLLAAAQSENILTFVSTGNCMGLLFRKNKLSFITLPDSLADFSQDDYNQEFYSSPMSGLGLFDDIHLNTKELKILNDDIILLLTDGAYSRIKIKEIKYILDKNDLSFSDKIVEIFNLVNSRGNLDNQSAILLKF